MKSKLSFIISALFVALMLVNSVSAQRSGSDQVRSNRVYLACQAVVQDLPLQVGYPPRFSLTFEMTNNSGAWLAEGKIIHFSGEGKLGQQTVTFADNEKKTLDVMVPVNGSVTLFYKKYEKKVGAESYGPPFTCQAWFLK